MKKLLTMFMTMIFVASMSLTAFADNNQGVITINNNPATTGVTMTKGEFFAVKIFNLELGNVDGDNKYNYTLDEQFKAFFADKANDEAISSDDAKLNKFAIDYVNAQKDDMQALAKEIRAYVNTNNLEKTNTNGEVTVTNGMEATSIENLELGYYIVLNEKSDSTAVIAAALGTTDTELNVNLKGSAPTIDKEILHNETGEWGIVGDNAIGDDVQYRLTGKLPSNVTGYTNYDYTIYDSLTVGLTFNNDLKVFVLRNGEEVEITQDFTVNQENDQKFSVTVDVLGGVANGTFELGDTLYFKYSAKLNEDAVLAGESNDNTVYLEYSNNPYDETSKDQTVEVTVKDYTFRLDVFKTGEDGETALEGAKFEIHRDGAAIRFKKTTNGDIDRYVVCTEETHGSECVTEIITSANGRFEIVGLDDAVVYTLKETEAPEGYNAIDDIEFTINASYDDAGNIVDLTTTVDGIVKDESSFALKTTIVNTTGIKLPETGGVGTGLFTIVGGLLMVSAATTVVKRRKN